MVSDLIQSKGRSWNEQLVTCFFGGQLVERIIAQTISIAGSLDVRVWWSSCTSRMVTRDLYDLYREESVGRLNGAWIWRLDARPRVCLFI